MPVSSFANDAAWSLLTDKVDKAIQFVPVIIGGIFAGMGAASGSGVRLMNPETGKFDPGFHEGAMIQDPVTGGLAFETSTDSVGVDASSTEGRVLGGATGALQGVNPATYIGAPVRFAGKGIQAAGRGIRTSRPLASTVRTADGVTDITHGPLRGAGQLAGRGIERTGQSMRNVGRGQLARTAGRFAQTLGGTEEQFGPQVPALISMYGAQQFGMDPMSGGTTGFGTGFGGAGGGVNDISNVQGNALGDKQIWNPEAYRGQQRFSEFEGQGEFGGFGTQKGETMFVNNKGNEIKKEVTDLMYKAKCSACDKKDCLGKMHCGGMNKAKDSKKPAHGMVIVIGSKAGPGPSKNGKREKLDSEKKEE